MRQMLADIDGLSAAQEKHTAEVHAGAEARKGLDRQVRELQHKLVTAGQWKEMGAFNPPRTDAGTATEPWEEQTAALAAAARDESRQELELLQQQLGAPPRPRARPGRAPRRNPALVFRSYFPLAGEVWFPEPNRARPCDGPPRLCGRRGERRERNQARAHSATQAPGMPPSMSIPDVFQGFDPSMRILQVFLKGKGGCRYRSCGSAPRSRSNRRSTR